MAATQLQTWERRLFVLADEARHPAIPRTPAPVRDLALLQRAYARCDAVIAEHGKTFNLASSLLPPAKRRAIRALYAFCRVSDNIVDDPAGTPEAREAALEAWRQRATAARPPQDDPSLLSGQALVAVAWADTRRRYQVSWEYADQLIDGVRRDLHPRRYRTFDELATYAYSVASTVGLMSMSIIGRAPECTEEEAIPYLIKLGLALQLTNILRDVGEDWRAGRVYLPAEELAFYGLGGAVPFAALGAGMAQGWLDERWRDFMRFQVARNRALYAEAWPGVAMFSRDGRFAVVAACALYSRILNAIEGNNYDVFNRRAHVSTWGKLRRLPAIWLRER